MNNFPLPIPDEKLHDLLVRLTREDSFVFLETTRVDKENLSSYLFLEPVDRLICKSFDDPGRFFKKVTEYMEQGYYLAGWLAYEFGYLLEPVLKKFSNEGLDIVADLGVFRSPYLYDHRRGTFVGDEPVYKDGLPELPGDHSFEVSGLRLSQAKKDYLERISRIKEYIETGDTYQVNYTLKFLFGFAGSAAGMYETLRRNQSVSYGAFIKSGQQQILSFSPELFFKKTGSECLVRPMKGTSSREPSLDEDRDKGRELASDGKNRSENVMIVDLLRNDLGRLCRMGEVETVSLFDVETYETLHQMTSSIRGRLRDDVGPEELFRAIFPCGSVTGAPKIRTMEIIKELETAPRGVYTGGIGFIAPNGDMVFNVPIRTVVIEDGRGEMGTGSGIVYYSDPEKEWEECCLKARFLTEPEGDFQLIETILWHPEQGFWLLDRHLERLADSAAYWGMPFDETSLREELAKVVNSRENADRSSPKLAQNCLRVRLLLHKDGKVDTTSASCSSPFMWFASKERAPGDLPKVVISDIATDSRDPFLYHKTTRRGIYDSEYRKALDSGYYEVLFENERREITEGSISNVFIERDGTLLTPPLRNGLLNGILRRSLLAGETGFHGLPVREAILKLSDLKSAEAVYIGNSVRGLVQVDLAE